MSSPSKRHEELVAAKVEELKNAGWHVVTIGNCHPDAIAIKDGVIMAVEILKKYKHVSKAGKNKGWKYSKGTMKQKLEEYAHYDKIAFVTFYSTTGEIADQFVIEPKNAGVLLRNDRRIYGTGEISRDGDTTDNRKRIRPLENAPPDCPHCRDPETDQPIAMVEGLSESGHERLACPACGLVAVEVLAGGHPYCKQCGRMMQVIGTQFTNTATMIEYGCPVCDLGGKEAEP